MLRCKLIHQIDQQQMNLLIFKWNQEVFEEVLREQTELTKQIKVEKINNSLSTNSVKSPTSLALSYETHLKAIYTSKLILNFFEPKISDDYYERYDNIISEEYSSNYYKNFVYVKIFKLIIN